MKRVMRMRMMVRKVKERGWDDWVMDGGVTPPTLQPVVKEFMPPPSSMHLHHQQQQQQQQMALNAAIHHGSPAARTTI